MSFDCAAALVELDAECAALAAADVDVITEILNKGKQESGKGIRTGEGTTNLTKGSFSVDTKGKQNTSGI